MEELLAFMPPTSDTHRGFDFWYETFSMEEVEYGYDWEDGVGHPRKVQIPTYKNVYLRKSSELLAHGGYCERFSKRTIIDSQRHIDSISFYPQESRFDFTDVKVCFSGMTVNEKRTHLPSDDPPLQQDDNVVDYEMFWVLPKLLTNSADDIKVLEWSRLEFGKRLNVDQLAIQHVMLGLECDTTMLSTSEKAILLLKHLGVKPKTMTEVVKMMRQPMPASVLEDPVLNAHREKLMISKGWRGYSLRELRRFARKEGIRWLGHFEKQALAEELLFCLSQRYEFLPK